MSNKEQLQINNETYASLIETLRTKSIPSGVELPTLSNEGTANDLFLGKQLIDSDGEIVNGTFTIDNELDTQTTLLSQIQTAIEKKKCL